MITGSLVRGARGILGWSVQTLARRAHVGTATILRIEHARSSAAGQSRTIEKIERALADGGVHFTEGAHGEIGLSLDASEHREQN